MSKGVKKWVVLVQAHIADEILVEAKNPIEAAEIGEELFLKSMTKDKVFELFKDSLEAVEIERAKKGSNE